MKVEFQEFCGLAKPRAFLGVGKCQLRCVKNCGHRHIVCVFWVGWGWDVSFRMWAHSELCCAGDVGFILTRLK